MTEAIVPSARPSFVGRMDTMTQTIRIHELSADGCLVVGEDHSPIGHRICLQINLAGEGWIAVEAETVHPRQHVGIAMTFVNLSEANRARIERAIECVLVAQPQGVWTLSGAA